MALRHSLQEDRRGAAADETQPANGSLDDVFESRFDENGRWLRPPSADAELLAGEIQGVIGECLERVPDQQRMAFTLREVEGLATREICKILDVTRTNFGVMLYRARNELRECLEEKGIGRSDADRGSEALVPGWEEDDFDRLLPRPTISRLPEPQLAGK